MDDNLPCWEFAPTHGGDEDGFSDAYIETYTGDIDKSLAREIIQNSMDARLNNDSPVKVSFKKISLKKDELPGAKELANIFEKCIEYFNEDRKVNSFFNNAKEIINQKFIEVLKISDYNTTGLRGDDHDKKGEWYNLVKAQGATSKQEGKLGSFGIGKGAPFAASVLRIVFYSTINDKNENVFQGKARLVSHIQDGTVRRGTDIFIIGYKGEGDLWKPNLIKSVLENFWAAIYNNDLIVEIDEIILDKNSLEDKLKEYFEIDDKESPYHYYLCYKNPAYKFEDKLKYLGECKLYINLMDNAPKKIALMRQSRMLIKLKHFRSPKPFIGVFICDDENGNEKLRELEPPQHNDWEPKRTPEGTHIIHVLEEWIREKIKSTYKEESVKISTIPGLEKYFQLPEDIDYETIKEDVFNYGSSGEGSDKETANELAVIEENKNEIVIVKHDRPVINKTLNRDKGIKPRTKMNKGKRSGGTYGSGNDEGKIITFQEINCSKRAYIINNEGDYFVYRLILEPYDDYSGDLEINFASDEGDAIESAQISNAKNIINGITYTIDGNKIKDVVLTKSEKVIIELKLNSKSKASLIVG